MPNASGPMACPVDGATLVMSERSGIEIDYCPTCRGVWLDRGELDKMIERNAEASAPPPPTQSHPVQQPHYAPPQQPAQAPWGQQRDSRGYDSYGNKPPKRRKGFLEELFD